MVKNYKVISCIGIKMVGIRVDANEYIASGHVMRCLSIADALLELGEDVVFFTSDSSATELIINRGYSVVELGSEWDNKDSELEDLIRELDKYKPRILLVDSYQVTEHYLSRLHKEIKLAYIDDLNAFDYPVDIVINYSIYAEDIDYPKNKAYLLGTEYTPLRKQFDLSVEEIDTAIEGRRENKQILVMTGAADPYHVAENLTNNILREPLLNDYKIVVVKGIFSDDICIEQISGSQLIRVRIMENVENMAELMLNSYMAVSAGGSTLYELCACCVPTVTFSYADNQLGSTTGFARKGIMNYAGDVRTAEDVCGRIISKLVIFSKDCFLINNMVDKMRDLHCLDGAKSIAMHLQE